MKSKSFITVFLLFFTIPFFAQVYTDKIVGEKNQQLKDSLKEVVYPYALPIWGQKVAQKGYNLPYSAGLSVNYFWSDSEITIKNLEVGFNNGPLYNLDEIVRFNKSSVEAGAITIRPDIWLLPFLNVYGIFGKSKPTTKINAGIWIPDANNDWSEIASFSTKANFDATTVGIGLTPTIGIGGGWLALDMNMSWSDVSALNKPAFSYVFGPRLGKTFKLRKPERNIAAWVGGFRIHINGDTQGNIALSDVLNLDNAQQKVDNGLTKVSENQTKVDTWWNGLTPAQQNNPANIAKHNTADRALQSAGNFLTTLDGALSTAGSSTIQYSLQKAPKDMWNFIVGTQFQYNKHMMFRLETGFLGTRTQVLCGIQYRFGL
ncbi:hypothetical protein [Flavobacterium hibernum]|uniref:Outer membrane protein beta-barrel domain-containing protein n=1 Tax=Flavobacterium hibernum TaxID=37752 RepID=A0A0D0F144_9FLAO|nr:hypothetical protein [Flavobacterium hibernum]KIO51697.1 hypothetical protein IW18_15595 [Flavobacterium hibernum]OXA91729.1 hypothetical protein B0A73_00365 [Flavobacterium hibernum]STO09782.1 Uncharacterised protein [Flavobacterium hibernum]